MPSKPAPASRSTAVEDYLEQILDLINTKGYARAAEIAQGVENLAGKRDEAPVSEPNNIPN